MREHDDVLDSIAGMRHLFDTPIWYIVQNDTLIGVLQLKESDTWAYRRQAEAQYPDAVAWNYNHIGWCFMSTNNMRSSIWCPSTPPDVVLMAKLLEA